LEKKSVIFKKMMSAAQSQSISRNPSSYPFVLPIIYTVHPAVFLFSFLLVAPHQIVSKNRGEETREKKKEENMIHYY